MENKRNVENLVFLDGRGFEAVRGEGDSNTPHLVTKTVCLDYLKMGVNTDLFEDESLKDNLVNMLGLKNAYFDDFPTKNYSHCMVYDEDIHIFAGGTYTVNSDGSKTSYVELKGQALRRLEARGVNYLDLFDFFVQRGFYCLRIDLPIDDFGGEIKKEEIEYKVKHHYFSTRLVSSSVKVDYMDSCGADENQITIDTRNKGWSVTIGGRSSRQLCIYDKLAERRYRGFDVSCFSWLRYESRFYHDSANVVFLQVYKALHDSSGKSISTLSLRLLRGLIEFKSQRGLSGIDNNNGSDRKKIQRANVWPKWARFVHCVVPFYVSNQSKLETTICRRSRWVDRCVSNSLIRLYLAKPDQFLDQISSLMNKSKHVEVGLTAKGLAEINNDRVKSGKKPLTEEEAVDMLRVFKEAVGSGEDGGDGNASL